MNRLQVTAEYGVDYEDDQNDQNGNTENNDDEDDDYQENDEYDTNNGPDLQCNKMYPAGSRQPLPAGARGKESLSLVIHPAVL